MKAQNEKKDPFDDDYVGNIWGWRNTYYGLALILILLGLMIYRHISLGIPLRDGLNQEKTEQVEKDSI